MIGRQRAICVGVVDRALSRADVSSALELSTSTTDTEESDAALLMLLGGGAAWPCGFCWFVLIGISPLRKESTKSGSKSGWRRKRLGEFIFADAVVVPLAWDVIDFVTKRLGGERLGWRTTWVKKRLGEDATW